MHKKSSRYCKCAGSDLTLGVSCRFITHNIGVVESIAESVADPIAVMNRRRIEESGPARSVLSNPASSYTRTLLAAVPRIAVSA